MMRWLCLPLVALQKFSGRHLRDLWQIVYMLRVNCRWLHWDWSTTSLQKNPLLCKWIRLIHVFLVILRDLEIVYFALRHLKFQDLGYNIFHNDVLFTIFDVAIVRRCVPHFEVSCGFALKNNFRCIDSKSGKFYLRVNVNSPSRHLKRPGIIA